MKKKEFIDWADLFYEKGCGFHIWDIDRGSKGIKVARFTNLDELKKIKDLIAECKL